MKKLQIALLMTAVLMASCAGARTNSVYNNPPGYITMSASPMVFDSAPEKVNLMMTNNSDQTAQFGANYTIEKYTGGKWELFPLPQFAVIAIMYMLPPGQTQSYDINLFPDQVAYTPGKYRIVKAVYLDITGDSYYTAEFEVR